MMRTSFIAALLTAAPLAVFCQAAEELAPLQQDSQIVSGTLPNGLRYLIRPTQEPAGRASMRLRVNVGSLNEQPETSGISHLLEHLVFNGSRHFKRGELIPAMQKLGLGFGGDANAYTSLLQTVYMLDLPNLNKETTNFSFTILRDFADGATLTDEAIEHERGIVFSEKKARDSAAYRAMVEQLRVLCNGTRVPEFLPIGTDEVILQAKPETFRNYYRSHYVPENMTLIITGDVNPATMQQEVQSFFGSMQASPAPQRPEIGSPVHTGASAHLIANPEQANSSVSINIVSPWQFRADTIEQRIADLPLTLACSMLNQRLSRMAKKPDSPFIGAESSKQDLIKSASIFAIGASCEPVKWKQALTTIEHELRRACQYGFSQQELQEIINMAAAASRRSIATWDTVQAAAMATSFIKAIDEQKVMTTPMEDARALQAGCARIMADPDICRRALQAAYDSTRAKLIINGNIPQDATAESLTATYQTALQQEVAAPAADEIKPFAYGTIGTPGHITHSITHEDIGVTCITLSNGVRVNLKPVDFADGNINIAARIDGGESRLAHTPGLNIVAESVMNRGGLEAHTADELTRLFAGHTVSISFGAEADRFVIGGTCTPADIELQCKLLAAGILHPGFRNEGEIMMKRRLPALYNRLQTTPDGAYSYQANRSIYSGDIRFCLPPQEQLENVSTEQVKTALLPWLQQGAMEVSIVGDFSVQDILPIIERTFGAMPQRKAEFTPLTEQEESVSISLSGQQHVLRYDTELDKTLVTHVFAVGNGQDKCRNRRLQVLTSIVREKLFNGIRAELGETYSPVVRLVTNSDYANAAILTAANSGVKGNRLKVHAAMSSLLYGLAQENGITQNDFDCAIRPYITRTEKSLRNPAFWQGALAHLQSDPEQIHRLRNLMGDIRSITLQEVQALAREIFGSAHKADFFFTVPRNTIIED